MNKKSAKNEEYSLKDIEYIQNNKDVPEYSENIIDIPEYEDKKKELPKTGNAENVVDVCGEIVEIKPTKLKYHRDRTALFYHVVEKIPLPDILSAGEGVFANGRDGDKCLFDFLVAIFDDVDLVRKNYNNMDAELIFKSLEIFKRVNKITDVEENSKNKIGKETKA